MKTNTSGNGVKVANLYKLIRERKWTEWNLGKVSAKDLLAAWDYRGEGLNVDQAKAALLGLMQERKKISEQRINNRYYPKRKLGHFLNRLQEKRERIRQFEKSASLMDHPRHAYRYSYGRYNCSIRHFSFITPEYPFPVIVAVTWDEDHDWNFYAKSYNHPKSTYSNRRIEFKTIGKLGQTEIIFTYFLKSFSGNFIEKAIAAFYKIEKEKCPAGLGAVQLAPYFRLFEVKAVNGFRIFKRFIGMLGWDYALLDTKTGETYHAWNEDALILGFRNKIRAKIDQENKLITKETGYALGFCESGMRHFCDENNLDFDGEYTRRQLRNVVVQNRKANQKFRRELSRLGINLGK